LGVNGGKSKFFVSLRDKTPKKGIDVVDDAEADT
jgi:hypothetical protein